ncbi:MAG: NAD(P)/FAD-dependent oxidoreductase [Erysipelothrix sp.]|nr:NAD(P)/FAD-dependent oxidoreductase [Erysipelothrix sp.]
MIKTDIFILGKGPAGIQAAIYAKRANVNPIVVGKDLGMCVKADVLENYYGVDLTNGTQLVEKGIEQAESLGIEVVSDEVLTLSFTGESFIVKTKEETYEAKTFLFASGLHRNVARVKNIMKYEGKGVSYCAVCDAFFYRNKSVAVLGHSDYAASEANELIEIVDKVTVFTNGETPTGNFDSRIEIITDKVVEVSGEDKIEMIHTDKEQYSVSGVFVALGTASSTDLAKKVGLVIEKNRIVVNEDMETNIPGLYAAGDCTPGYQQIAKAVGDGCVAGMNMAMYVRKLRRNKK